MRFALAAALLLAALAAALALPTAAGDAPEAPRPLRIATFDLGRVDEASLRKKDGMAAIEEKFAGRKSEFERKQSRLSELMNDLQSSIYRPGSPEYQRMAVAIQNLDREVKHDGIELTRAVGDAKSDLLRAIYADLQHALDALAAAEGLDFVFQLQTPSEELSAALMARQMNAMAVYYAHPRFDVTDRIVEAMNKAYEK